MAAVMDKRAHPSRPVAAVGAMAPESVERELESLLTDLRACQDRLLAAVREHRAAISAADPQAIKVGLERHRAATEDLRLLEERRARLGTKVIGRAGAAGARPTLGELLGRVPVAARERLTQMAAGVREVAIAAQREQKALGEAAMALAGHMEGLMRGVAAKVSEAGVYGRRGYVETPARPVGSLDVSR